MQPTCSKFEASSSLSALCFRFFSFSFLFFFFFFFLTRIIMFSGREISLIYSGESRGEIYLFRFLRNLRSHMVELREKESRVLFRLSTAFRTRARQRTSGQRRVFNGYLATLSKGNCRNASMESFSISVSWRVLIDCCR